jgi:hypothetical protein
MSIMVELLGISRRSRAGKKDGEEPPSPLHV